MTDLPDIKLRAVNNFPATAQGGTGISIEKVGGIYDIDLEYGEIMPTSAIPDKPTTYVMLWNSATDTYSRISVADLKIALGIV